MTEYCSKYYTLKASIKEQNISIKDKLKIQMLNNFELAFKTYLTIVNDWMWKDEKLEKDKVLFKAIEKEKTCIKAKYKAFANFVVIKSNVKSQEGVAKKKKNLLSSQNIKNRAANI